LVVYCVVHYDAGEVSILVSYGSGSSDNWATRFAEFVRVESNEVCLTYGISVYDIPSFSNNPGVGAVIAYDVVVVAPCVVPAKWSSYSR